ncbi:hypothetical protein [Mycolicibacterium austroafricanum]|uniref:hypothetical protein n=1 Tax=Mycolicibacterium austroafricanum TaxID=39687 RepID=UPI000564AF71|nr:hypothetical protein [Mycolicibacterium austroafricanum]
MQSATEKLAEARTSLHTAVAAVDDSHYRRQHAHHAATLAADVTLSADATADQKRTASIYLDQAVGMRRQGGQ